MSNRLFSSGIAALSFTVSAGILGLALTPAVASAATVSDEVEVVVTGDRTVATKRVATADLDLTSGADLKRLDARIRGAISDVCDDGADGRITLAESRCRSDARRSSYEQVAVLRSQATALASAAQADSASEIAVVAAR